jgi:hypothetical protein
MRWLMLCLMVSAPLCGCTSMPEGKAAEPPPPSPTRACPVEKLRFTQAEGCSNDGSVEFCVQKDDPRLVERLRAVGPEVHPYAGGGGRAGCDTAKEALYFFDTLPGQQCVGETNAMTDAAWEKVCRIAAEPAIRKIVPTWFE